MFTTHDQRPGAERPAEWVSLWTAGAPLGPSYVIIDILLMNFPENLGHWHISAGYPGDGSGV